MMVDDDENIYGNVVDDDGNDDNGDCDDDVHEWCFW